MVTDTIASSNRGDTGEAKALVTDLRKRAEEKARSMAPLVADGTSAEEARRLLHELRVHGIELELQNDELRRRLQARDSQLARYRDIYDLTPLGYLTVSEAGMILEANLRAATLLGVARDTLLRQPLSRFILPEDQDIFYCQRRQLLVTGEAQVCELRLAPENGEQFLARLEVVVAPGQEIGAPVYRAMLSDITASKRREREALATAANLAAILEAATESILIIDAKGKILTINPTAAARLGKGSQELIGTTVYSLLPKALAASRKARVDVAVNSRTALSFQDERQGRHYATTLFPVCEASGKVARVIILAQDISDRVVAEGVISKGKNALEHQVRERTAELAGVVATLRRERDEQANTVAFLRDREHELEALAGALQESNAGLTTLLLRREQDRQGLRDELLTALKKLVLPAVARLKRSPLTEGQQQLLRTVEVNLDGILAPVRRDPLLAIPTNLTMMEMQVANLIKEGKKTVEIATLLNLSPRTVDTHRNKIRKKMGIPSRKVTLRDHLLVNDREG